MAAMAVCAGRGPARAADEHPCHLRRHDRLYLLGRHRYCGGLCAGFQHREPAQLVDGQLFRHDLGQRGHSGLSLCCPAWRRRFCSPSPWPPTRWGRPTRRAWAYRCAASRCCWCCCPACWLPVSRPLRGRSPLSASRCRTLVKQTLGSAKPLHVLPGCVLGGAAFCLLCDLIARSLFAPTELSISSVTAVFGAPVVIWLLVRRHSGEGTA